MSTYLIIGGSRGIGMAFVKQLAAKSENLVLVTVRKGFDVSNFDVFKNVKLLYVDIGAPLEDVKDGLKDLRASTPNGIDVIIHNAAITDHNFRNPLQTQNIGVLDDLFHINIGGIIKVYQAIYPRLEENGKPVKYVVLSSLGGRISGMQFPAGIYGATKAATNYITVQIAKEREHKGDIVVPIHTCVVDTDGAASVLEDFRRSVPVLTPDESAARVLEVFKGLTIQDTGKFYDYEGNTWAF